MLCIGARGARGARKQNNIIYRLIILVMSFSNQLKVRLFLVDQLLS